MTNKPFYVDVPLLGTGIEGSTRRIFNLYGDRHHAARDAATWAKAGCTVYTNAFKPNVVQEVTHDKNS